MWSVMWKMYVFSRAESLAGEIKDYQAELGDYNTVCIISVDNLVKHSSLLPVHSTQQGTLWTEDFFVIKVILCFMPFPKKIGNQIVWTNLQPLGYCGFQIISQQNRNVSLYYLWRYQRVTELLYSESYYRNLTRPLRIINKILIKIKKIIIQNLIKQSSMLYYFATWSQATSAVRNFKCIST